MSKSSNFARIVGIVFVCVVLLLILNMFLSSFDAMANDEFATGLFVGEDTCVQDCEIECENSSSQCIMDCLIEKDHFSH